ncbi:MULTISPECIES: oxidoreductase [Mycobacterium]|jgi:aryl-alcohol dehydrogenase-like predicted oxidoreductase|uniref:Oxidoreductase n=4 Tax=Mycobacterium avium complex (MAC) TaxID=120793 RepID=A0A7R7MWC1_MYCIT|nr:MULTISPECIES: oxidoreductase [Mycobacterium]AFC45087.1 aldo/keto reductase [Mycobacterium intracellulare ATCC 13950]AFC50234.1 aldo/keto reductase [Mycobacterium intracellulare MOTT-02]AFC55499.1 aldo/keto reductase [Mycobacterium paraintracellulare]AFJ36824.1 aldo/keto reductase [Mycobacterium sp. MOTT36Y]AFS15939.1 Putative oxidoreductase ydbC [Mycobacterium intracellulare subsp. intracellulare MTCC 9506]
MDPFPLGGFSVNRVGFGAMQLPGPNAFGPPRDRDEALAVLRRAVELGVDHIDTAQIYGPDVANELIREALHPYPPNLALVSKVGGRRDGDGAWLPAGEPAELRRDIETNLRTLGVERLAVVNLRVFDSSAPDQLFDDQLSAMISARDAGLIGAIGLSNVSREQLAHACERTEIACVQNAFNLIHRESAAVLGECTTRGIAFVPFFPLGAAFMRPNPVLGHQLVQGIAQRLGRTPAQVALAWTLGVAPNVLLIPGTSSLRHLEENVDVASIELDDDDRERLNAVAT